MKAMLIDTTRCIGCRGCQVACKEWNDCPGEKTEFFAGSGYQNPRDLSADTWTLITYNEVEVNGRFDWVFGKLQCLHCIEPACASACPVHALEKMEEGPVIYHKDKCLGCRYCMLACPFLVPRFEWRDATPVITKCTMCADRVAEGEWPACAKVCPTGAIIFGEREELIHEAETRIRQNPNEYVHHIYGKDEVGGTSVLHLSNVSFETLGYRTDLPKEPLKEFTQPAMSAISGIVVGLSAILGGLSWIINRRIKQQEENNKTKGGEQ